MRALSASVAARLLLTTSQCLAGSEPLAHPPAEAQFVCVGSADGNAPFTGAGATATGSSRNLLAVKMRMRLEPASLPSTLRSDPTQMPVGYSPTLPQAVFRMRAAPTLPTQPLASVPMRAAPIPATQPRASVPMRAALLLGIRPSAWMPMPAEITVSTPPMAGRPMPPATTVPTSPAATAPMRLVT